MSWLSSLLNKKIPLVGESVGGLIGSATGNPVLQTGVEAARGGNIAQNITQDALQGAKNTPLAIAGTNLLGNGSGSASPGVDPTSPMTPGSEFPSGQAPDTSGAGVDLSGLADAIKGGASAVASWLRSNGGGLLQAAGIADSAYRETQANKYATQALSGAQSAYDAKAPLRALGIAGLTNAGQGNPFATRSGGALPIAGQGGLGANLPGASPTDVLNQQGANTTSGGKQLPRQGNVPAPIAPPNLNPSAPMRIAGY